MVAPLTRNRAYIISLLLLLLGAAFRELFSAGSGAGGTGLDLTRLPLRIDGWIGQEIPVSQRDRSLLGTESMILRRYRKEGDAVNLFILECSSNRASFHPPEYCYVGGRTEMVERGRTMLYWDGGEVSSHRFLFRGPRGKSLVYYWYAFGGRFTTDYYRQQLYIVAAVILGRPAPALLIRLSVEGTFDPARGDAIIAAFAREAIPVIRKYLLEE